MEPEYWIRIRGRVQGPFTADRLHSMATRGRFNRFCEVSEDGKSWFHATDFPELFEGTWAPSRSRSGAGGPGPEFDDLSPFGDEPSPFGQDQFDQPPPRQTRAQPSPVELMDAAPPQDADYDEDDDDWDDDEYEGEGFLEGLTDSLNEHPRIVLGCVAAVMFGLGWYFFGGEGWGADRAAYDTIVATQVEIEGFFGGGPSRAEYDAFVEEINVRLAPMVERLEQEASARDHLKQELLMAARDEIPMILVEIPRGSDVAQNRLAERLRRIDEMLTSKRRQLPQTNVASFEFPKPGDVSETPDITTTMPEELVNPETGEPLGEQAVSTPEAPADSPPASSPNTPGPTPSTSSTPPAPKPKTPSQPPPSSTSPAKKKGIL